MDIADNAFDQLPPPASRPWTRRLPLAGAVNFRDLGGYPTASGRRLKRGLIFRSDHLSLLTPGDLGLLADLQLKLVCDFRTVREQQQAPDRLPPGGVLRRLHLPVQVNGFDPALVMGRVRAGDTTWFSIDFFTDLYRRYLDECGPVWGQVLRLAAAPASLPLVFHCTGGKDRTGICAALLLMALGVPEETIRRDHELSNACNAERLRPIYADFASLGLPAERVAPFLLAQDEPLLAMLNHLWRTYGSAHGYLQTKAGLSGSTIKALHENLLEG